MSFQKIIATIILISVAAVSFGRPATRRPVLLTQPDGSTVEVQLHGDEFHHWMTADGVEVIVGEDGYVVPATMSTADRAATMMRAAESRAQRQRSYSRSFPIGANAHSLVVLVQFQDERFRDGHDASAFSALLNERGYSANGAIGSAFDYFYDNSGGTFDVVFDVVGPVTVSREMAYYGSGDEKYAVMALIEACAQLDSSVDSSVDFSKYDTDHDGVVDNVFFFYAGYNEADSTLGDTIWPHAFDVPSAVAKLGTTVNYTFDGVSLGTYACTSEIDGMKILNAEPAMTSIGTFCHEFGHVLGLPDMYDTVTSQGMDMVYFSLMASGCDVDNGKRPPYLTAVERQILGWGCSSLPTLSAPGTYTLGSISNNDAYILPSDTQDEYFILECRTGEKWDSGLNASGLLIYHVDKSGNSYISTPRQMYSADFIWANLSRFNYINADRNHPLCYVIASSPAFKDNSMGPAGNYLFPGDAGATAFASDTDPAAVGWSGKITGHNLLDISYSATNKTASFRYVHLDKLGFKGFCTISNPGAGHYDAGSSFTLSLTESSRRPVSVEWYFDEEKCQSSTITLPSGTHTITAVLTFSSGSPETLEQVISVD